MCGTLSGKMLPKCKCRFEGSDPHEFSKWMTWNLFWKITVEKTWLPSSNLFCPKWGRDGTLRKVSLQRQSTASQLLFGSGTSPCRHHMVNNRCCGLRRNESHVNFRSVLTLNTKFWCEGNRLKTNLFCILALTLILCYGCFIICCAVQWEFKHCQHVFLSPCIFM